MIKFKFVANCVQEINIKKLKSSIKSMLSKKCEKLRLNFREKWLDFDSFKLICVRSMIYKEELLILISVIISTGSTNFVSIPYDGIDKMAKSEVRNVRKVHSLKDGKELLENVDFAEFFKNLHRNRSPEEVRIVGILGLLAGALKVEEAMRESLYQMTNDLLDSFNKSTPKENMHKLIAIEETINRDQSAVSILNGMLQYARNVTTLHALQKDMKQILHKVTAISSLLLSISLSLSLVERGCCR